MIKKRFCECGCGKSKYATSRFMYYSQACKQREWRKSKRRVKEEMVKSEGMYNLLKKVMGKAVVDGKSSFDMSLALDKYKSILEDPFCNEATKLGYIEGYRGPKGSTSLSSFGITAKGRLYIKKMETEDENS